MKPTPVMIISGLVVMAAGGFMVGRISSSNEVRNKTVEVSAADRGRNSSRAASDGSQAGGKTQAARGKSAGKVLLAEKLQRMESIMRGENPLQRNRALLDLIDQMAPGEFADAVTQFRALGITDSRLGEYSLLLSAWAKVDPLSALEFAKQNTQNGFASGTILSTWATTDPDAALRWAVNNFEGDGGNPYLIGIVRGLAELDPERASQVLASMPLSEQRGEALSGLIPHILKQGPESARIWISSIQDERLKNGAIERMTVSLAQLDPKGTADWLIKNPGEAASRTMDDVYRTWAGKDQTAAMVSFNTLSPGAEKSNALRGIVTSVAGENPQAALAMMETHKNDVTDRMVTDFVGSAFDKNPAMAATTIYQIEDERQRNQMYRRTLDEWIERDLPKATAWIQSNQLPPEVAQRATRRIQEAQQRRAQ